MAHGNFDFKLRIYNASGVIQAEVVDFTELAYKKQVNAPGILSFKLRDSHPIISSLAFGWQVEVWVKPLGGVWQADFYSFFEDEEFDDFAPYTFKATCPGQMSMLNWAVVAWYAGTDGRSEFTSDPVETIMKNIVKYNVTSNATTANGRIYVGPNPGLSIATDQARGSSTNWSCAWKNVLTTLQELADATGTDFGITKTGATAWSFEFYPTFIGSDLRGSKEISVDTIMKTPSFEIERSTEKTVAIVGGKGEEQARLIVTRTGDNFSTSRHREIFVNVSNSEDSTFLQNKGDTELEKKKAKKKFSFDISQVPYHYLTDYKVGDITTVHNPYDGTSFDVQITSATVSVKQGGDNFVNVQIGVEEYA